MPIGKIGDDEFARDFEAYLARAYREFSLASHKAGFRSQSARMRIVQQFCDFLVHGRPPEKHRHYQRPRPKPE